MGTSNRAVVLAFLLTGASGCSTGEGSPPAVAPVNRQNSIIQFDARIGEVGGIRLGMTEVHLVALGYPIRKTYVRREGEEYLSMRVSIAPNTSVDCTFDSKTLRQIEIGSPRIRDRFDSGVGTNLGDLRARFPNGQLFVGEEGDGRHANFVSGTKAIFRLDKREIPADCFKHGGELETCVGPTVKVESVLLDFAAN